jgi:CheY-like chemotaxis protein
MITEALHILLAEDDHDDRIFFKDAISNSKVKTIVTTVNDGHELMEYLTQSEVTLPGLIFLDLNMPKKNGIECLAEIRAHARLKDLSIAIYSTSASEADIEETFVKGANVYIKKPNNFDDLKKVLGEVININWHYHTSGMNKENFLLRV